MTKTKGLGHLAQVADLIALMIAEHPEVASEIEALVVAIIRAKASAAAPASTAVAPSRP